MGLQHVETKERRFGIVFEYSLKIPEAVIEDIFELVGNKLYMPLNYFCREGHAFKVFS